MHGQPQKPTNAEKIAHSIFLLGSFTLAAMFAAKITGEKKTNESIHWTTYAGSATAPFFLASAIGSLKEVSPKSDWSYLPPLTFLAGSMLISVNSGYELYQNPEKRGPIMVGIACVGFIMSGAIMLKNLIDSQRDSINEISKARKFAPSAINIVSCIIFILNAILTITPNGNKLSDFEKIADICGGVTGTLYLIGNLILINAMQQKPQYQSLFDSALLEDTDTISNHSVRSVSSATNPNAITAYRQPTALPDLNDQPSDLYQSATV